MQSYHCEKINIPITIDGDVAKPEWEAAEKACLAENIRGAEPRQFTWAKMRWSREFLYIAFQCQDAEINASYKNFNETLYDEEVVEVFIDDDGDFHTYLEFEVNPLNAVLHYAIYNNLQGAVLTFARTERVITTAVLHKGEAHLWQVEMAIPWGEFVTALHIPPEPGDKWLFNLFRIDRPRNGPVELSAWSPTGKPRFHHPEFFGELIFEE